MRRCFCVVLLANAWIICADDWPRFLGPRGDGVSEETGLLDRWPAEGPRLLWQREIGSGYSAPSVRGQRLVLHHRIGEEEIVECFRVADGASLWRYAYPSRFVDPYGYNNGPRCTPLLTAEHCYTFGAEGKLTCVELATGKLVWQRDTEKDWDIPPAFFGVGSTPILEGNLLLVMIGGQPNAGMVAFDAATGATVWESVGEKNWQGQPKRGWPGEPPFVWQRHEKQASYASPVVATVHGKRRVFALMRQGLVMLDPQTGVVDDSYWFRARVEESVNAATPVVAGDRVFLSSSYYRLGSALLRVRSDFTFEEVWRGTVLEIHFTTPILKDGFLYAFSGRDEPDASFRCVEFETGKLRWERDESWQRTTRQPDKYGRGSAIFADGKLIVLGEGGLLGLFQCDPNRPVELARWQVPQLQYPTWTAPVMANCRLYLRSEERLLCFDLAK